MDNRYNQGLPFRQPHSHGRPSRASVDGGDGRWSRDPSSSYIDDKGIPWHNSHGHRGRPGRRSTEIVPLEDSVIQLSRCVIATMKKFKQVEEEFDHDVHRIRRYCEEGLVEEVWMHKVRPRNRSRNGQHGRLAEADDLDRNERQSSGLWETMKQLILTLDAALDAAENFRPSQRKPTQYTTEDIRNIHKRLAQANEDFRKSWRSIFKSRSDAGRMRTSLDELRLFLSHNGGDVENDRGDGVRFDDRSIHGTHAERNAQGRGDCGEDDEHVEEYSGQQKDGTGKPTQSIPVRMLSPHSWMERSVTMRNFVGKLAHVFACMDMFGGVQRYERLLRETRPICPTISQHIKRGFL